MIDAHAHLNDPKLLPHVDELLARMAQNEVTGTLVVGFDLPSSRTAIALAQRYPAQLRVAVGVHPHESNTLDDDTLIALRDLARHPSVVAIGEIGLDFHYDHSPRDTQRGAFRDQLTLAAECGLPIIIHERAAVDEVMAILDEEQRWACGGAWHCCSVTPDRAVAISQYLYIGIAGWITFKNGENIREIARTIALERLLIETDAPFLTPVPYRGHPNEPAYVRLTAQAVAEVKGIALADVEKITSVNTLQAFPRW